MAILSIEEAEKLESLAETNDGHCPECHQTIKIYRYKLNKTHALFLRAMAARAREQGVNDVDLSTIGLSYSVRTQVTKMRLHGLIARIKNAQGAQVPRHWLITHKGYDFLSGAQTPSTVVTFNNQVLGHDDTYTTIHNILGEPPSDPVNYIEIPISTPEARTYHDVRQEPKRQMRIQALYRGRGGRYAGVQPGRVYELAVERLAMGNPVKVTKPVKVDYKDIAAFQKEWQAV